ncbi:MAG: DUF4445 domain-containing protein, partial [Lentisphaeria bacterium]|nr:DUF4445 domain-containing protein [Lentisphaeria bacterium]
MRKRVKVVFQPSGRAVHVLPGTKLLEAAVRGGLLLRNPCGGRGTCGKCRVRLTQGECPPTPACGIIYTAGEIDDGWRLACQAVITTDCVFHVPAASLFESESRILTDGSGTGVKGTPAIRKRYIELRPPDLEHPLPDLERVVEAIGAHEIRFPELSRLTVRLRETGFRGTAVTCDGHLVDWEPGNTEGQAYAAAFDLGTTTLVGTLLETCQGRELAVAATMNPQIGVGDDVISRITLARNSPEHVREMQASVVAAFNELTERMCAEAGIGPEQIFEISVAGNTTMQHLFCGISPGALGEVPFVPAYRGARRAHAADLGLRAHASARVYVFPNIGGFVGGDTVAGILANGVHRAKDTVLFVDIGTNGEIVLAYRGVLRAASCAAGPAFEGARIVAGMRAAEGAIDAVVLREGDLVCNVIGGGLAAGICGTALIDAVAVLLDAGILDETGRILNLAELDGRLPPELQARLLGDDGSTRVLLASGEETRSGEPLCLYQRDVRELQLASGAIRAGITILLRQAGVAPSEVDTVLLAGGFGNYIRRENACRIGLLPDLPLDRIRYVGNAS